MQGIVGIDRNNSGRNRGILLSSQGRISRSKGLRFETLKNLNIDLKSGLGRNRFILIAKVNQKSKKKKILIRELNQNIFSDFWLTWANHFIHFDLRFNLIFFISIEFDFDTSRITIRLRTKIKSNQESKAGESLNQERIKVNPKSSWSEPCLKHKTKSYIYY